MTKEQWKKIEKYPAYEVSTTGKIRKINTGFNVPQWLAIVGGGMVALLATENGETVQKRVDRLVLETFKPNGGGPIIHKNKKIYDCTLDNLDYKE